MVAKTVKAHKHRSDNGGRKDGRGALFFLVSCGEKQKNKFLQGREKRERERELKVLCHCLFLSLLVANNVKFKTFLWKTEIATSASSAVAALGPSRPTIKRGEKKGKEIRNWTERQNLRP